MKIRHSAQVFLASILVTLLLIIPSGCSQTSTTIRIVTSTPIIDQENTETAHADKSYDGKEIRITLGSSLQVQLESNPSTGFGWELTSISDSNVLEKLSNIFETPSYKLPAGQTPPAGAGGMEFWTFKALMKGTSTISMEYSQPWDGGTKKAQTFSLTVTVN
ncbi:MAG: protease inhibitor I42 family protein [Dehalococcoidales bacterium]